jgi:chromosome segregation ATPase
MKEYIWKTEYSASSDGSYVLNQLGKVVDGLDAIPEKMYTRLYYTMLRKYEEALRVYKAMSKLSYEEGDYLADEKKRNPNWAALEGKLRKRVEQFKEIERQEEAKAREREIQEKKQRYEAYWAEHAEDRKRLESEKADALEQMKPLKEKVAEIEANVELKEVESRLQELKREVAALSIFKMKERKALKEQIAQVEKKETELLYQLDEEKQPFAEQISSLEKTIKNIDYELTKER